jgi:hypothetical protein
MAELAAPLIASDQPLVVEAREYLLLAALAGNVANGDKAAALDLWRRHGDGARASRPVYRLLRCHAEPATCAAAFRVYAD